MERPIFEKAHQALQALFNDPSAKQMIEDRAKAVANFSTAMDASREEGRLEGMQEGMQEGIEKGIEKASKRHRKGIEKYHQEVALNMHAEGINATKIARILKIDVGFVEKIVGTL